jgi:hypothetical protein
MTWADDGRAAFEFGKSIHEGEPHIFRRRVGTDDVIGQANFAAVVQAFPARV